MTEREKRLLAAYSKLESERSREDVIFQTEAMARAQMALKEDYGLVDPAPGTQAGKTA